MTFNIKLCFLTFYPIVIIIFVIWYINNMRMECEINRNKEMREIEKMKQVNAIVRACPMIWDYILQFLWPIVPKTVHAHKPCYQPLAATFIEEEGIEDIINYFNLEVKNWKV